jgi:hypothetical protein
MATQSIKQRLSVAGFTVHGHIGNFYRVTSRDGQDGIILRQSENRWHFFWSAFEGSASGSTPETCMQGGLGDVIDTDGQARSYEQMLLDAPQKYLAQCDGLYRESSNVFNAEVQP